MITGVCFLGSFFIGAIPTAYLFARYLKNTDIREHGSGNVGATNASRVLGKKWGLLIFLLDFLKGFLPALLLFYFYSKTHSDLSQVKWAASGAIIGHIFTPFLGFKGGKGVATGAGVLTCVFPMLFLLSFPVWLLVFGVTRIVSISSLAALGSLVLYALFFHLGVEVVLFFLLFFCIITWTHRENIARIVAGKER
jgi:acyl phosphate:glycerol-3-phosphate acyltransferase